MKLLMRNLFLLVSLFATPFMLSAESYATENSCQVSDDQILDRYRMHLVESLSVICDPTSHDHGQYVVRTTLSFDNGLKVLFSNNYERRLSAENETDYQHDRYSNSDYGKYKPGTEFYLEKTKKKYSTREFELYPCKENVDIIRSANTFAFDTLPQILQIELLETVKINEGWFWDSITKYFHLEIQLTDGTLWILDSGVNKPDISWMEGDRILVCIQPKEILFINVDKEPVLNYVTSTIIGFKFMGLVD
jgi:hypothetical protein